MTSRILVLRLLFFSLVLLAIFSTVKRGLKTYTSSRALAITEEPLTEEFEAIKPLFFQLSEPTPGSWRASNYELGQLFSEFKENYAPRGQRKANIYLQAVGSLSEGGEKLLKLTAEYLEHFFCLPVVVLPAIETIDIPPHAKRFDSYINQEQIETEYLLEHVLRPIRPDDALAYLAFTEIDLYPNTSYNFVFGQAKPANRVAVVSTARFGDAARSELDFRKTLRRVLRTSAHEAAHAIGLEHCISYQCQMNGSNSLEEADSQPLMLCAHCQQKLNYRASCKPQQRLEKVSDFLFKQRLIAEAARMRVVHGKMSLLNQRQNSIVR